MDPFCAWKPLLCNKDTAKSNNMIQQIRAQSSWISTNAIRVKSISPAVCNTIYSLELIMKLLKELPPEEEELPPE